MKIENDVSTINSPLSIEGNVPKLRFGEFEGKWSTEQLGSYSKHITYGLTIRPKFVEDGIPLISAREITSGTVKYSEAPQISLSEFNNLSDKAKPIVGDLFLSKTGTIGFSAKNTTSEPIAITQNIAVIRMDDVSTLSPDYALHYFKTKKFYRSAISKVNQSTIMDLQLGDIKRLPIPIPPNATEQQKIASFLSKVDEKIGLLSDKKSKLTEYKKGVMQQLFSGKWVNSGELKGANSGEVKVDSGKLTFIPPTLRFKADDGSEFPDWEEKKLGDVCEFRDSQRLPLSSEERQQRQGQYRYYGASGVIDYVDDFLFDGEFVLLGEDGANIITRSTPLAFVVKGKFWVNNHAHVLKALGCTYFLAQSLELLNYEKYNSGTAQPKLNAASCKKIELNMPCEAEQTKIANFLSAIDQKIELVNSELDKAKEWKKGLLQQMFV
ncbi:restriction endonuclease subunit S [Shewanella schlegeliana]|uniref:Restriction endonuclease subunit S n=1 Tax=Shewanella schlegeliana TaxID=190308 RepID=A0ABS1T3V4_9GAMM|nr:restriction endonuclease subunit S [Shewanella schlegeliana]MBL4915481.1 restriction endonuclease subunit S [Shewanella schlegeliana]MCL1111794.1 restriction endonuclease subunit S [Shewanella schlegeliana]